MFAPKPAATSIFIIIGLGFVMGRHFANAHNHRPADETIRRRTLRGMDDPSPLLRVPAELVGATNAMDNLLTETTSFWGRNLQGSGSLGKGGGGSGKGGGGGKNSGKGKGGSSGKGGKGDEPEIDIDRRVGSNDAGQWTRKPEENKNEYGGTNTTNFTAITDDI